MRILPLTVNKILIPRLLDDSKTMTRRILKEYYQDASCFPKGGEWGFCLSTTTASIMGTIDCPWKKGDVLYVREEHYAFGNWDEVEGEFTAGGKPKWAFYAQTMSQHGSVYPSSIYFPDTLPPKTKILTGIHMETGFYKRLARFMPKAYARIFLEVTDVKIERLGDISMEDCIAEGVQGNDKEGYKSYEIIHKGPHKGVAHPHAAVNNWRSLESFMELWECINGPDSWDDRLWVWVITFKRVERPANFLS